jgi:hypothetical protein
MRRDGLGLLGMGMDLLLRQGRAEESGRESKVALWNLALGFAAVKGKGPWLKQA